MNKDQTPAAKFKLDDKVYHKEQNLEMVVFAVDHYTGSDKGWLYTLFIPKNEGRTQYKRYYEDKLSRECIEYRGTSKAPRILFGKE